jgi:hypothetical protein
MKKFDFWKDNRNDQHHQKTADELKALFSEWLKTKEQSWLEYYSSDRVVRAFLTDKAGISSVFDENQFPEMYDALKPLYIEYTYPKQKA